MNIKEAFRYQKQLDKLMAEARLYAVNKAPCVEVEKTHKRSVANPDAEDMVEKVEQSAEVIPCEKVIDFMTTLIAEKEKLGCAISAAKASTPIDIDATVEANKYRQSTAAAIKQVVSYATPKKTTERGQGYQFNSEGNQMPYYYDIEVSTTSAVDRTALNQLAKQLLKESDAASTAIDEALVNTEVEYEPRFDVNDTLEAAIAEVLG